MAIKVNLNNKFKGYISSNNCDGDYNRIHDSTLPESVSTELIPDIKFSTDCFISMVGGEYDFYGMDHNAIKLNDMIFEILEDPDDGYRSYLGAARIPLQDHNYIFFPNPIAKIRLITSDKISWRKEINNDFNGYVILDLRDNHIWALIGTGNIDDYYPYFECRYFPKSPI
tara:strand:- start:1652 stop:2161 length:510 start_codon:yes stop_codon:yes gene_type:complete